MDVGSEPCTCGVSILIRAVNEPGEPSFWQNRLGSLGRKFIRAGPELEPS
jgi:hypothetical protein